LKGKSAFDLHQVHLYLAIQFGSKPKPKKIKIYILSYIHEKSCN